MKEETKALAIPDVMTLGEVFAQSGMFPDVKSKSQAVVKVLAGKELGFGPIYSMCKVFMVQGKVAVAAEAMGAMVKRSGRYDYSVKTLTDTECVLQFTDNNKPAYESHFTMEDARRANLIKPEGGWVKWPRAMLMSKALSQGARIVCPHIISGVYTAEDMEVETTEEGEVVPPIQEPSPLPPPLVQAEGDSTPKPTEGGKEAPNYTKFWIWARDQGLTKEQVHSWLGIQSLKDYVAKDKTLDAAKAEILKLMEGKQQNG